MTVVIVLVLVGIIIYLASFNTANNNLKQHIQSQGGLEIKYSRLISLIKAIDPNFKILKTTDKTITIGHHTHVGYLSFHITHTFDKLHVRFNLQDKIMGYNKFDWEFHPNLDQDKMFEEIQQGLTLLDTKLSNKHSL